MQHERRRHHSLWRSGQLALLGGVIVAVPTTAHGAPSGFPVDIRNCGQTLHFDAPAKRAVAMDQVATEALLGLKLAGSMVGTANQANPIFPALAADYAKVPVLAKGAYPSKEVLLNASPDIVVGNEETFTYSGFPPGSNFSRKELADRDIAGFTLLCKGETRTQALLYARYRQLGRIFGATPQANAFVARITRGLSATRRALEGVRPVPTFFYQGGQGPLVTYGGRQDGIVLSGGVNLFRDLPPLVGGLPPAVSLEKVIARNPGGIVMEDVGALDPSAPSVGATKAFLRKRLSTTGAVRSGRICVVGFYDFTGGLRTVRAVRLTAKCLHPGVKL